MSKGKDFLELLRHGELERLLNNLLMDSTSVKFVLEVLKKAIDEECSECMDKSGKTNVDVIVVEIPP